MTDPIIIIGAGLAGWTTARELRKLDANVPLSLISADSADFYAKPSLSNALAQRRAPAQLISSAAATMAETSKLTLLAHTKVLSLNPGARTISTTRGEFRYSHLVLATGAQPIRVPVGGDAADQVLSVNSLADYTVFHERLTHLAGPGSPSKHVLIMGAGLIGCEFANDLAAAGHRVTVVDPSTAPISALLPPQAGAQLRAALEALGVRWHFGTTVKSVHQMTGAQTPVLQVELSDGQRVEADLVLSAIGLKAATQLAQAAGLVCERGVLVDATLRTSAPNIYALGDSAQYATGLWGDAFDQPGGPVPTRGRTLPYVMPIMNAAKALAATLAGTRTELVFPLMPVAIKTPALPIVVAPPAPGTPGGWIMTEPGIWRYLDPDGVAHGFVLTGPQTARRTEQAKLLEN